MSFNTDNLSILASAARTATQTSDDQRNARGRGIHLVIDVTAGAGFSITPIIEGKDPVSGKYYTILTGAAITTTGTNVLKIYPGISANPNASANDILPKTWRVRVTHADATSVTYSVGANLTV